MATTDGLNGLHSAPSASIRPAGSFSFFANNFPVYYSPEPDLTKQSYTTGFNYSVFNNLELGTVFSTVTTHTDNVYIPRVSLKYQFKQLTPESPLLSIGVTDLFNKDNYIGNAFFVSSIEFYPFSSKMTLETGALYQNYTKDKNPDELYTPIRAFLNIGIDYKDYAFYSENKLSKVGVELNQFFMYRPFTMEKDSVELSLTAGYVSTTHYPSEMNSFVASIQFTQNLKLTHPNIEKIKKRDRFREPPIRLSITPITHMLYQDEFFYRAGFRSDIAIEMGIQNFLWVNSFNTVVSESEPQSIAPVTYWSKKAIQYEPQRTFNGTIFTIQKPRLLLGYIEKNARGFMWNQRFSFLKWRTAENTIGIINTYEDTEKPLYLYNIFKTPIHPPLSGVLQNTQVYIEGGIYKGDDLGGALNVTHEVSSNVHIALENRYTTQNGYSAGLHFTTNFSNALQKTWEVVHASIYPTTRFNTDYTVNSGALSFNSHPTYNDAFWEPGIVHANDHLDSSYYRSIIFCRDTVTKECEETNYDRDSLPDHLDACPNEPEDYDGFLDSDGCPDMDDDKDNIPDTLDSCRLEPEDIDGFEDQDGCPEPDNDKDGIPDTIDKCVMEKEDIDLFEDQDGCPDLDNDQDGIPDNFDRCVDIPEDHDGIDDGDGCPDLIDDDRIPEILDNCPELTEDYDGFEDEDGCPDEDNDGDGIPDYKDKCPNQYEVFNSFFDEDGCPE